MSKTKAFEQYLLGCRFCPMCKPASDSLNATLFESHATRAHAMMIWRELNEGCGYTAKQAELLYMCNLDGVAEAFCVDHYPTTKYMLAAREDIVAAGKAPAPVQAILEREQEITCAPMGDALLFVEGVDIDYVHAMQRGSAIAKKLGVGVIGGYTGYIPYVLGSRQQAKHEAEMIVQAICQSGAKTLIATGPESYYTFTKLYAQLGVMLPVNVVSLTQVLFKDRGAEGVNGKKLFFHDARAAFDLGDTMPDEKVIMPDFFGPEEDLGKGTVYEAPREALKKGDAELVFMAWSRAMANAMGNDEGVSITYPKLAEKMAERRMRMIAGTGAQAMVTDSLATAVYLDTLKSELLHGMEVLYLGDL